MTEEADLKISADVLIWARKQRGLSISDAAKKLGIIEKTLEAIEAGGRAPSLAQLRKMTDVYKRPLIVLLLDEPPRDFQAMRDFRSVHGRPSGEFSPQLHDELRRAAAQQDVYIELRAALGETADNATLPVVSDSASQVAETLLTQLRVTVEDRSLWRQPRRALAEWRGRIEGAGVLVLETSRVKVSEMRGFSLSERTPYVVVVNGEDSERGKIFTMAHELAHLSRRASGVCDLHNRGDISTDAEVFCNAVAGRVLLPWSLLAAQPVFKLHKKGDEWSDDDLDAIVRVAGGPSREVVLRRLLDAGYVSQAFYEARTKYYRDQYEEYRAARRAKKSSGGPSPHLMAIRDRGRPFLRIVFNAYSDGVVDLSDLVDMTGVRAKHLNVLEAETYR